MGHGDVAHFSQRMSGFNVTRSPAIGYDRGEAS